ncbi:uncharacterized protein BJX67DRAFT_365905 [Aspergillus lucknowensis]|uniref:Uncharacterized protein n=1 Tax=Aspergillus lucknowensis TaxID=176173 RepID=A0ABR4LDL5_9EURO
MPLSTEATIALVGLLITGTPSLLLLVWNYLRQRSHRRTMSPRSPDTSSLLSDLVPLEPMPSLVTPRRCEELQRFPETGQYTRRARTDLYLSQVSISVDQMC